MYRRRPGMAFRFILGQQNRGCHRLVGATIDQRGFRPIRNCEQLDCLRNLCWGIVLLFLLSGSTASALSTEYLITGGRVEVSVSVGGTTVGSTLSSSLSGSFTTDAVARSLNNFSIVLEPDLVLNLSSPYGGYDSITIESARLSAGLGFSSTLLAATGDSYTVLALPLTVDGLWGGTATGGAQPAVSGQSITYSVPVMTAVLGSAPMVYVNAVTLNSLNGSAFGEAADLVITASIQVDSATVIPEPGTGLLLTSGLLILRLRRRAFSRVHASIC